MHPLRSALTLAAALLAVAACNPYQCVYETRSVSTQPNGSATAAGTFSGHIGFRDYSANEPVPATITWNVQVTGKPASLTNVTLVDKRNPSVVLATIGIEASGVANSSGAPLQSAAERDRAFDALASGNAVLVAEVNGGTVNIPLVVETLENWHHPQCD
jgi:hypothetical protein